MNIDEAKEDYIHYIRVVDQKSLATVSSYTHDLDLYTAYLNNHGISCMEDITVSHLQDFLAIQSDQKAAGSVNRMIVSIHMFHRFISMNNPDIDDPSQHIHGRRTSKKLPKYFNVHDIEILLDSFDESDQGLFDKAILEVLYGCGLRVSELCGLHMSMINLDHGFLRVIGKGDKERMIPMHQRSIDALQNYIVHVRPQWLKKKTQYVFVKANGNPLLRQDVHKLIKARLHMLGLNEALSAHSFRHSFATHLLDGGTDLRVVQELLGHSDIATTQIYTHIQNKKLKDAYTSFHPFAKEDKNDEKI